MSVGTIKLDYGNQISRQTNHTGLHDPKHVVHEDTCCCEKQSSATQLASKCLRDNGSTAQAVIV